MNSTHWLMAVCAFGGAAVALVVQWLRHKLIHDWYRVRWKFDGAVACTCGFVQALWDVARWQLLFGFVGGIVLAWLVKWTW